MSRPFPPRHAGARHAAELLRQGPDTAELLPLLTTMGDRLARRMAGALAPLLGGEAPHVAPLATRIAETETVTQSIADLAANSLMEVGTGPQSTGPQSTGQAPLLLSIEAEPVLRIVDHAFGGKGEAPVPLPTRFPMAAELMIGRLESLLASHIGAAVAATQAARGVGGSPAPAITTLRRDSHLPLLAPFAPDTPLAVLQLEVDDGGVLPWLITLALPLGTLARLFGYADADAPLAAPARRPAETPPLAGSPFADLPLTLGAVLVDMAVPFGTLAALRPGQVLPVAIAREIPLRLGDATIAHGTIGAIDERIAVQITSAFAESRSPKP